MLVLFLKQKTAYEMRISDWSSDVCAYDLDFSRNRMGGADPGDIALDLDRVGAWGAAFGVRQIFCMDFRYVAVVVFDAAGAANDIAVFQKIGRSSCRERVCQYV